MAGMDSLAFSMEWYDKDMCQTRCFLLKCYPDNTIELFDKKNNKRFLSRSLVRGICRKSFYLGAVMDIHSRQMKVVGYGNEMTLKTLEVVNERTFALVKPDGISKLGKIIDLITSNNLRLTRVKMVKMYKEHVLSLYSQLIGHPSLPGLVTFLTSGPVVAIEMIGPDAVEKWQAMMGPTDPILARIKAPYSVRAKFGADVMYNTVHGSETHDAASQELALFFPEHNARKGLPAHEGSRLRTTAVCKNCTCVVIQPHAIKEGLMGKIVTMIQENGFVVSGMELFNMNQPNAMEFYEIYKGIVPEYRGMLAQLCSGSCMVLELTGFGKDTVAKFRRLAGSREVDAAKELHPETIRAKYGHNNVENAVHCTDLPSDGEVDSGYFFRTLQMFN